MSIRPSAALATGYDVVWKTMHWLIAAIVITLLFLGGIMSRNTPHLVMWHESLGLVVLPLMLLRLVWRLGHRPPPLPGGLRPWEALAANLVHKGFYILLFIQPLVGWSLFSLSSQTTRFFGGFPIPRLPLGVPAADAAGWREVLAGVHGTVGTLIALLLVLHVGAAFKHHFMLRDDVLLRMAPGGLSAMLRKLRGER